MMIEQAVKGVKSYSEYEYHSYISDRNKAFANMNERTIKRFFRRWNIEVPESSADFWVKAARMCLTSSEHDDDIPGRAVAEAKRILDEFNAQQKA